MSEATAEPPSGEFKEFSSDQILDKLAILRGIIEKYAEHAIVVSIDDPAFREIFAPKGLQPITPTLKAPDFHAYMQLRHLAQFAQANRKARHEQIDFVFDGMTETGIDDICSQWRVMKADPGLMGMIANRYFANDPVMMSEKDAPPLQISWLGLSSVTVKQNWKAAVQAERSGILHPMLRFSESTGIGPGWSQCCI